jgi:hypothetical protein
MLEMKKLSWSQQEPEEHSKNELLKEIKKK